MAERDDWTTTAPRLKQKYTSPNYRVCTPHEYNLTIVRISSIYVPLHVHNCYFSRTSYTTRYSDLRMQLCHDKIGTQLELAPVVSKLVVLRTSINYRNPVQL